MSNKAGWCCLKKKKYSNLRISKYNMSCYWFGISKIVGHGMAPHWWESVQISCIFLKLVGFGSDFMMKLLATDSKISWKVQRGTPSNGCITSRELRCIDRELRSNFDDSIQVRAREQFYSAGFALTSNFRYFIGYKYNQHSLVIKTATGQAGILFWPVLPIKIYTEVK